MSARVVGVGYHDTCFRWDLSTPQPCNARLLSVPALGNFAQPGRTLFASRDRFGRWEHYLGARDVMIGWVSETKGGTVRRLEVQAHLGPEGENDLCSVAEFADRYEGLLRRMAIRGVLPSEDPRVVRVDVAVDVEYGDPQEGRSVLEALRYARWPRSWYAEFQGPPPYTTVAVKLGKKIVARAYCRNSKLRNGAERWGKLRFEREHRFVWANGRSVGELSATEAAAAFWGSAFGAGSSSGRVIRLPHEAEAAKLIEWVELGELTSAQYEQLLGFMSAERLGLVGKAYPKETAQRRRSLARKLGVSPAAGAATASDVALDDLMRVPRSAWSMAA
jgi:hypothetical protein